MPQIRADKPNSQVNDLLTGIVIFEERNVNMTPNVGTLKSAEGWATLIAESLRGWIFGKAGGLVIEPAAVAPAHDYMGLYPGLICYRVGVSQRLSRTIIPRCDMPIETDLNLMVTLTNGANSSDAIIYWTNDGSFPGPASGGNEYNGPFPVNSGDIVQWAAAKPGFFLSNVSQKIIT